MVPSYKMLAGRIDEEKKNLEKKQGKLCSSQALSTLAQHILRQNPTAAPLYIPRSI